MNIVAAILLLLVAAILWFLSWKGRIQNETLDTLDRIASVTALLAAVTALVFPTFQDNPPSTTPTPPTSVSASDSIEIEGPVIGSSIIQSGEGDDVINVESAPTDVAFDKTLYNVQIDGNNDDIIVAYNRSRFPVWQNQLDTKITKVIVADMDGDAAREVIIGLAEPGEKPGRCLIFDEDGNLLSEYNVWEPSVFRGGAKEASNIVDFEVVDLIGDGTLQLIILANDTYWYASKLAVLEFSDGHLHQVSRYWNPGLLYTLDISDLNNDAIVEIVVTGVNNDLQAATSLEANVYMAFLLSGSQIAGQAPPWFGNDDKGTELWYSIVTPEQVRVSEVDFEDFNGDGNKEVHLTLSDVCSYYLDIAGNIVGRGRGTACQEESELFVLDVGG